MKQEAYYANKIAVVTGAAQGIGKALTQELLRRGAVVYAFDVNTDALRALSDGSNANLKIGRLDVTNQQEVKQQIELVIQHHGRIDFLFNNAGIAVAGEAHEIPAEIWWNLINTNITGTVNMLCTVYTQMVMQRSGHIVNIASLAGLTPVPLLTAYSMTKHSLVGLGTSLRTEAARFGVRVSTVCPAAIETPLLNQKNPSVNGVALWRPNVRLYLTNLAGKPQEVEVFARRALDRLRSNPNLIFSTSRARMVYLLQRLLPGVVGLVSSYYMRKELIKRANKP